MATPAHSPPASPAPAAPTLYPTSRPPTALQCMEIWGGFHSVDQQVATPGLDIWVYSRPHGFAGAGGDVYYASLCGGGTITRVILADVCGHGSDVAGAAEALRGLMRKHINRKAQDRLMRGLNRAFAASPECERFATAVVATYLTRTNRLTVGNAGHPRPLWYSADGGRWSVLCHADQDDLDIAGGPAGDGSAEGGRPAGDGGVDLPLGLDDGTGYTQVGVTLGRGDLVLFYTDALTEAVGPAGRQLGEDGLLDLARKLDPTRPAAVPRDLVSALDRFRGGAAADDDATFVLLHHNAGPARPPTLAGLVDVFAKVLGLRAV